MIRTTLQVALCLCFSPLLVAQNSSALPESLPKSTPKAQAHAPCWVAPADVPRKNQPKAATSTQIPDSVTIPMGTMIKIRPLEHVTSETAIAGASVSFEVAEALIVDDTVVLPVGAPVNGIVAKAKPGIPYRQWPDLEIQVKEVKVGSGASLPLVRSDPRHRANHHMTSNDVAECMLLLPLCIASAFGVTEDGPSKPNAESGILVEVTPCETWYFWTRSSIMISASAFTGPVSTPSTSTTDCPQILENPACDYLEIK